MPKWMIALGVIIPILAGAGSAWSTVWILIEPHAEEYVIHAAEKSSAIKQLRIDLQAAQKEVGEAKAATKANTKKLDETNALLRQIIKQTATPK